MQFIERRIIQLTLQILLFCLLESLPATFGGFVTNTNDAGPGSLRFAVQNASPGETITFDASLSGKKIVTLAAIALDKDVRIDASALSDFLTIGHAWLQNDDFVPGRIMEISAGCSVTLKHLQITEGWVVHGQGRGAGILNHGRLTLANCSVTGNDMESDEGGGGICNAVGGNLTAISTIISGNIGDTSHGNGIYNEPGAVMFLSKCVIQLNGGGSGSAIYNAAGATADVVDCQILNHADTAVLNAGDSNNRGVLRLTRCIFSGNNSPSSGHAVANTGTLEASLCTFSANGGRYESATPTSGGACDNSGTAAFRDCTFQANFASDAGAIGGSGGSLEVTRCSFLGNVASAASHYGSGLGGAILCFDSSTSVTNCTFMGNHAEGHWIETPSPDNHEYFGFDGYGGAINCQGGSLSLESCTIVGNFGGDHTPDSGAITLGGFPRVSAAIHNSIVASNLVNGAFATNNILGAYSGSHNLINADPKLGPLGNYGGPTPTLPLLAASPAIDAGEATSLATDQRGFPRRAGPAQDIGSLEFNSILPPPPTITVTHKDPSNLEINFDSIPGVLFTILAADQLTPPEPQWLPLGIASEQNGHYTFVTETGRSTPRYFQVRFQ